MQVERTCIQCRQIFLNDEPEGSRPECFLCWSCFQHSFPLLAEVEFTLRAPLLSPGDRPWLFTPVDPPR